MTLRELIAELQKRPPEDMDLPVCTPIVNCGCSIEGNGIMYLEEISLEDGEFRAGWISAITGESTDYPKERDKEDIREGKYILIG